MPKPETDRRKLVQQLKALGWSLEREGAEHALYVKAGESEPLSIPRHATLSPGVARQIAKRAGLWK